MSLRIRLNLLITLLFLLVFISGSFYVIDNARTSVKEEVKSTARLTLQLINIALTSTKESKDSEIQTRVLEQIASMESIRHLHIELHHANNPLRRKQNLPSGTSASKVPLAPQWFIKLVTPDPMEFRHVVDEPGARYTEIIITANPADEITEVWNETKGVLVLMVLFLVLANVLVFFTLGSGLAPIETILMGLERIERGDYKLRLPRLSLPELSRISEKFNLMAEVLQRSQDDNKFLTQRSLAIQEDERRNLAYELHDELGQSITAIKAVAVSIEQQSIRDPKSITESADTIIKVSNRMYDVARNMMRRLRPPALDELGLITALQDMIDDWNSHHEETFCSFSFEGDMEILDGEISISLYRIVQESLTNVVKHAEASNVKIRIAIIDYNNSQYVDMVIEDNGRGFDNTVTRPGLGLLGMRERVAVLQGSLQLDTRPGAGVRITITLPLTRTVSENE